MELSNNLTNEIINNNNTIETKQNKFLSSTIGKVIDKGVNIGLRAVLPNIIEDQVIDIKDAIIQCGFKSGVKQAITSAIDLGKSAKGLFTGKFESVSQAKEVVKNGGIIDSLSIVLKKSVNKAVKNELISKKTGKAIIKGKNTMLDILESNIENNFVEQQKSLEKIDMHCKNWIKCYNNKDFEGMEKEYNNINSQMKKVLPLEETIKNANKIENLQNLIKNNNKNFNLSKEEIALASQLV